MPIAPTSEVGAAREIGLALREPEFPRMRTGIPRGLVVEREGRLFGGPINLTAPLAGQAQGGQILCTDPIAQTVRTLAAIDPVCRMQVAVDHSTESVVHEGKAYRFCSRECARAFASAPALYAGEAPGHH